MDDNALRPDVVAGRFDPAMFDPEGLFLLVNEVFYTFQGEGRFAGDAATFVRLAKCNLKCKFCDTEFERGEKLHIDEVLHRVSETVRPFGLVAPRIVVLTGGEPALQNCIRFVTALHQRGVRVHVETSGSVWHPWLSRADFVTISPKVLKDRIPKELLDVVRYKGGQVKWIVNDTFMRLYERNPDNVFVDMVHNCLQPESQKPEWTAEAVELVMRHPDRYTLSMQMHKYAGVP